jgi:hypothetical protein
MTQNKRPSVYKDEPIVALVITAILLLLIVYAGVHFDTF